MHRHLHLLPINCLGSMSAPSAFRRGKHNKTAALLHSHKVIHGRKMTVMRNQEQQHAATATPDLAACLSPSDVA